MKKTLIIAFEGIDGSGKGVQLKEASERLSRKGYRVGVLDFPVYDSFFGKEIGIFLSGKEKTTASNMDVKSMSLWYAMDRSLAFNNMDLSVYDIVLLKRSTLSNAVYQSNRTCDEKKRDLIAWIHELEYGILEIPKPDLFIVFDVTTDNSRRNVSLKGHRDYVGDSADVYEKNRELLDKVRQGYIEAAKHFDNVWLLDCTVDGRMRPIEEIAEEIERRIESLINQKR